MIPFNNLENKIPSHTWKSSSSMYESSGSQFFRTTTEIESGPHIFDKSRFVMTFLTILRVTEIICSFRLVLKKFFVKVFNNVALSDAEDKSSGPLNRGGIADLPLLRTLLAIC